MILINFLDCGGQTNAEDVQCGHSTADLVQAAGEDKRAVHPLPRSLRHSVHRLAIHFILIFFYYLPFGMLQKKVISFSTAKVKTAIKKNFFCGFP